MSLNAASSVTVTREPIECEMVVSAATWTRSALESEVVMTTQDLDALVAARVGLSAPGVAVVIFGPEGVRAQATFGRADLASNQPMTTKLAMPWFSMTKIATATVVMALAGRQLIDLDAPVRPQCLPWDRYVLPTGRRASRRGTSSSTRPAWQTPSR